jgi:hypothetical protein
VKSNTLIAVEWLWSLRGANIWLRPGVLTAENKDPASPNLTIVEAISIFKYLQEKGLIFPAAREGCPGFCLHEAKIQEWNAFIRYLEKLEHNKKSVANLSPKDEEGDDQPNDDTGGATPQNGGGELPPERNDFRVKFFEVGGGGIALIIGIMLDVAGFHKSGLCFDSIALACAIGLLDHYIKEKTKFAHSKKLFWALMSFNFGLLVFLWFYIFFSENPTESMPQPSPVILIVSQPTIPVEPLAFRQKHEGIFILMGNSTIGLPPVPAGEIAIKDIGRAFLAAGTHEHPSQIHLIADENQAVLNIKFAPIFGMPPLELTNNELSGLPNDWDCNHSAKGIEIVNKNLIPIFQIYYKDDTHLVINGAITFIRDGGIGFVLSGGEGNGFQIKLNPTITDDEFFKEIEALKIKRIFKYPAWEHPGEFED